ncbi:MAG: hypothetical protein HGA49_01245 [Eubacteriaceae bacterium]|nr:hypothetical protein [Eubacteriaceae bacterium]
MSRISKTKRRTQYINKKLFSIILIFCLMLGSFPFGPGAGTVYATDQSASMLTDLMATITQDGVTIPEGGT